MQSKNDQFGSLYFKEGVHKMIKRAHVNRSLKHEKLIHTKKHINIEQVNEPVFFQNFFNVKKCKAQ